MTLSTRWDREARPQKDQVRSALLTNLGRKRSALFLPGNECLCVKEAIAKGVLGQDSFLHAIERDPETSKVITETLNELGIQSTVFNGDLSDYEPGVPLDYAMLDLMGPLDQDLASWLSGIVQNANPGFSLSMITTMNWRNSTFMRSATRTLWAKHKELIDQLKQDENIGFSYVVGHMAVLRSVLRDFDFDFKWTIRYRDTVHTMMAFRLVNFRPAANGNGWPSIGELTENTMNTTKTTATSPAVKAWETRRKMAAEAEAAAIFAKRSASAHKAWETRRSKAA
jgi:hypothetical protein